MPNAKDPRTHSAGSVDSRSMDAITPNQGLIRMRNERIALPGGDCRLVKWGYAVDLIHETALVFWDRDMADTEITSDEESPYVRIIRPLKDYQDHGRCFYGHVYWGPTPQDQYGARTFHHRAAFMVCDNPSKTGWVRQPDFDIWGVLGKGIQDGRTFIKDEDVARNIADWKMGLRSINGSRGAL